MSDIAISCRGLGKRYRIGQRESYRYLRDTLADALTAPVRRLRSLGKGADANGANDNKIFWALKDVSFDVKRGDVVGIIGRNGAGKSTLLKILSRITEPTAGEVDIYGRVGSLLEVGTGFHPELTGRENIYLNGAILGMKRDETESKFDEIVAFAELEKFLDTPVKRYSSGMYMRLAFSVAAHLEPEILLVDEVLAVGDAAFQKKCLGKMSDVAKEGRTIVFVSHNMAAVKSLCQKAILLNEGTQIMSGSASEIVDFYLNSSEEGFSSRVWPDIDIAPGNNKARIHAVRILDEGSQPTSQEDISKAIMIEIEYWALKPGAVLNTAVAVYNHEGVYVLASPSTTDTNWFQRPHPVGLFRSRCKIPGSILNQGRYNISTFLVENGNHIISQLDRVISVEMVDRGINRGGYFGYWGGVVRPNLEWETQRLAALD